MIENDPPIKVCPRCGFYNLTGRKNCTECSFLFFDKNKTEDELEEHNALTKPTWLNNGNS